MKGKSLVKCVLGIEQRLFRNDQKVGSPFHAKGTLGAIFPLKVLRKKLLKYLLYLFSTSFERYNSSGTIKRHTF